MSVQAMQAPEYHYIAYIDEAGDPGLKKVKPHDKPGSSEWLILSAVVIGAPNERNVVPWVRDIIRHFKATQLRCVAAQNSTKSTRKQAAGARVKKRSSAPIKITRNLGHGSFHERSGIADLSEQRVMPDFTSGRTHIGTNDLAGRVQLPVPPEGAFTIDSIHIYKSNTSQQLR